MATVNLNPLNHKRDMFQLIQAMVIAQDLEIQDSDSPIILAADVPVTIFIDEPGVQIRVAQNVGTVPILWRGGPTNVAANNYNGILAACASPLDGLGSVADFSRWRGKVSMMAVGGEGRIAVFRVLGPEARSGRKKVA